MLLLLTSAELIRMSTEMRESIYKNETSRFQLARTHFPHVTPAPSRAAMPLASPRREDNHTPAKQDSAIDPGTQDDMDGTLQLAARASVTTERSKQEKSRDTTIHQALTQSMPQLEQEYPQQHGNVTITSNAARKSRGSD